MELTPSFELPLPPREQTAALRKRVEEVILTPADIAMGWASDEILNRFLLARSGDVEAAAIMYEKTVCFRRNTGISGILDTYSEPRVMQLCLSGGFCGVDREGFPVSFERIGTTDLAGIHAAVLRAAADQPAPTSQQPIDAFVRWMAWNHEVQECLLRRWCLRTGRSRGRITFVVDLEGVSMRHLMPATLSVLRSKAVLDMDHYPENVRRVFLINTPQVRVRVCSIVGKLGTTHAGARCP
jgi:hypothetical protein